MPDLDRPRLALYFALGLVVCLLGARYVLAQGSSAPEPGAGAGAVKPRAPDDGGGVRIERAGGGRVTVHV
ncbi:MAG TPA: hypothetical protein VGV67_13405, partial [Solirubrobacteraceae bacterium]|nr:hypothetical protein [Solirubrobacteraceae bacterium]